MFIPADVPIIMAIGNRLIHWVLGKMRISIMIPKVAGISRIIFPLKSVISLVNKFGNMML
jgi:hypothetical protein